MRRCIYSGRLHFCPKGRSRFPLGFIYTCAGSVNHHRCRSPLARGEGALLASCPRSVLCTHTHTLLILFFTTGASTLCAPYTPKKKSTRKKGGTTCLLFLVHKPLQIGSSDGRYTFHSADRSFQRFLVWLSHERYMSRERLWLSLFMANRHLNRTVKNRVHRISRRVVMPKSMEKSNRSDTI